MEKKIKIAYTPTWCDGDFGAFLVQSFSIMAFLKLFFFELDIFLKPNPFFFELILGMLEKKIMSAGDSFKVASSTPTLCLLNLENEVLFFFLNS